MSFFGLFLQKIKKNALTDAVKKNASVQSALVFIFFFAVNSAVYFSVSGVSSQDDQWFYFKIADLFRTNGWATITDFKWLYFTNLAQDNLNYGITLYHFFLVPFTFFQDKIFGMKLAGVVFASAVPTLVFYVWKRLQIKRALFWALFFYIFVSADILWRLFINRSFVLIDGLILLEIYFLHRKKYWPLFFVAMLHTWWHTGTFWVVPMMAILYELIRYANSKKIFFKNILAGVVGACLGFIFYPPHSDQFFSSMNPESWIQSLSSYFYGVNTTVAIRHGGEVYKRDFLTLFTNNYFIFIVFIFLIVLNIALYIYRKKNNSQDLDENSDRVVLREFLFALCIILALGVVAVSFRFQDLLLPCLMLGFAISAQFFSERDFFKMENAYIRKVIIISGLIFLSYLFANRLLDLRNSMGDRKSYEKYEKVGAWLKENTQKNEIIYNTDWGQAPVLFFYNDWNYYVVGLEPKSLYRYNQELYWLWHNISYYGTVCNDGDCKEKLNELLKNKDTSVIENVAMANAKEIAPIIKEKFKSNYVFFNQEIFLKKELDKDKDDYELAYSDIEGGIYIYRIK
jgi:hypothetical protein